MDCKFIRIFKVYLGFDIKYRSSKIHVFLLFIKPVFPMFDKSQDCSSKCGCILKAVRGTWNFVWQQATLVQGCTSEAQLNMDVNLCRLPDLTKYVSKFLVPLFKHHAVSSFDEHSSAFDVTQQNSFYKFLFSSRNRLRNQST